MAWGSGTFPELNITSVIESGTFVNVKVSATQSYSAGQRGINALPIALDWGTDGEVIEVDASTYRNNCKKLFGYSYGDPHLMPIEEAIAGGATTLYIYRTNSGEKATGTYATARCSGELGNEIDIVIDEDPDD